MRESMLQPRIYILVGPAPMSSSLLVAHAVRHDTSTSHVGPRHREAVSCTASGVYDATIEGSQSPFTTLPQRFRIVQQHKNLSIIKSSDSTSQS
jgi:hypothetical protein